MIRTATAAVNASPASPVARSQPASVASDRASTTGTKIAGDPVGQPLHGRLAGSGPARRGGRSGRVPCPSRPGSRGRRAGPRCSRVPPATSAPGRRRPGPARRSASTRRSRTRPRRRRRPRAAARPAGRAVVADDDVLGRHGDDSAVADDLAPPWPRARASARIASPERRRAPRSSVAAEQHERRDHGGDLEVDARRRPRRALRPTIPRPRASRARRACPSSPSGVARPRARRGGRGDRPRGRPASRARRRPTRTRRSAAAGSISTTSGSVSARRHPQAPRPLLRPLDALERRLVSGRLDGTDERLGGERGGVRNRGALGREVDARLDAVEVGQRALDPRRTGRAVHAADRELDAFGRRCGRHGNIIPPRGTSTRFRVCDRPVYDPAS